MKKVLLDTNIILDFALKREKYIANSRKILELAFKKVINAFITATTITDIYYIARKEKGRNDALDFIRSILSFLEVANVDKNVVITALELDFHDFEDAVQESAAQNTEIPAIITRNENDFKNSSLRVFSPESFLKFIEIRNQ